MDAARKVPDDVTFGEAAKFQINERSGLRPRKKQDPKTTTTYRLRSSTAAAAPSEKPVSAKKAEPGPCTDKVKAAAVNLLNEEKFQRKLDEVRKNEEKLKEILKGLEEENQRLEKTAGSLKTTNEQLQAKINKIVESSTQAISQFYQMFPLPKSKLKDLKVVENAFKRLDAALKVLKEAVNQCSSQEAKEINEPESAPVEEAKVEEAKEPENAAPASPLDIPTDFLDKIKELGSSVSALLNEVCIQNKKTLSSQSDYLTHVQTLNELIQKALDVKDLTFAKLSEIQDLISTWKTEKVPKKYLQALHSSKADRYPLEQMSEDLELHQSKIDNLAKVFEDALTRIVEISSGLSQIRFEISTHKDLEIQQKLPSENALKELHIALEKIQIEEFKATVIEGKTEALAVEIHALYTHLREKRLQNYYASAGRDQFSKWYEQVREKLLKHMNDWHALAPHAESLLQEYHKKATVKVSPVPEEHLNSIALAQLTTPEAIKKQVLNKIDQITLYQKKYDALAQTLSKIKGTEHPTLYKENPGIFGLIIEANRAYTAIHGHVQGLISWAVNSVRTTFPTEGYSEETAFNTNGKHDPEIDHKYKSLVLGQKDEPAEQEESTAPSSQPEDESAAKE